VQGRIRAMELVVVNAVGQMFVSTSQYVVERVVMSDILFPVSCKSVTCLRNLSDVEKCKK
jgi:hypothetical protein